MSVRVLVVEDDAPTRAALKGALEDDGYEVVSVEDGDGALRVLDREHVDAVVCDVVLGAVGSLDGTDVLSHARSVSPCTVVILVTGFATVESAVDAIKGGAFDYLTKPVDLDRLALTLDRGIAASKLLEENRRLRQRLREQALGRSIVGESLVLRSLLEDMERMAASRAPVLVTGETGTGRNLVASALHHMSARAAGPLVRVICASISQDAMDSELFGHDKGAFPGAVRARRGRFEMARGGTLVLEEVDRLPASAQGRLLRILECDMMERPGSSDPVHVDARVVAIAGEDLAELVAAGTFREDLYYRLSTLSVEVPPLRDRSEDVPLLVEHFLDMLAADGHPRKEITLEAIQAIQGRRWPGNVRELRNCLERAVLLSRGPVIHVDDLPTCPMTAASRRVVVPVGTTLQEAERSLIDATLCACGGNKSRAARVLGLGLRTLYRRLGEMKSEEETSDANTADLSEAQDGVLADMTGSAPPGTPGAVT